MLHRSTVSVPIATLVGAACLVLAAWPATAENFTVEDGRWSHDADAGDGVCLDDHPTEPKCTLNAAIEEGNFLESTALDGAHNITFAPSVLVVDLTDGSLAELRAKYTITGNLPNRTVLDGAGVSGCFSLADSGDPGTGHELGADGTSILNMVIQNCNSAGISANGHGFVFLNNFIGVDSTGANAAPNDGDGISISSSREYDNVTDQFLIDLFNAIPGLPLSDGDIVSFSQQLNTELAAAQLGPVLISGNVISGNVNNGIEIFSENLAGVFVELNWIGTDWTGNSAIPNGESGIRLVGSPFANLIGPGNIISGNTVHGIENDAGDVSLPNFVMGNRIGISATNSGADIGNGLSGVTVDSKPDKTTTGHINPSLISMVLGPFNVISDNKGANNLDPDTLQDDNAGILITGASAGVKVIGNTVGLGEFPPGTPLSSLAYGNAGDGIIVTVSGIAIGGSGTEDGNVIAGNVRHGLVIRGSDTNDTTVLGNSIGVHPDLADDLTLGNGGDGIHISAAGTTTMGGTGSTDFNTIAANGRNGVKLRGGGYQNGWGNLLQRNRIYGNAVGGTGIGIDLDRVANAEDPTDVEIPANYANLSQVAPVICTGAPGEPAACSGFSAPGESGGTTTLNFTLTTHDPPGPIDTDYRVEFFQIDASSVNAATSMTYLGEQTVTAAAGTGVLNCPGELCTGSFGGSTAGSNVVMTVTDVTQVPAGPNTGWMQLVQCLTISDCLINNTSEFSNVVAPVLLPMATTTAVTQVSPGAAVFGESVDVTATVTAASGLLVPTGSVTIDTGAGSCVAALGSPAGLTVTGTCTLSAPAVSGSPYTVTASYPGNLSFAASASSGAGNGSLTVSAADTTTTLTGHTPEPSFVGAPIAVTASVAAIAPGGGTPTGTITVSDGTDSCLITLPAPGCNLVPTTPGAKTLVATYAGDGNFNSSASGGDAHQVDAAGATTTTTAVTIVSPGTGVAGSIVFGQAVTVTVEVTASAGTDEPTGNVTVSANGSSCPAALGASATATASGSCILTPAPGVAGSPYTVVAAYAGDATFAPSSSAGVADGTLTVNQALTTTTMGTHTPDPSNVGAPIAVAATVAVTPPGVGAPTGTVTVSDGTDNCQFVLPALGCDLTPTTSGPKNLTASYGGDVNFVASTSPGVSHQVNAGGGTVTTTAVTNVNPTTSVFGQTVAVSVSATAQSGANEPTGSVTVNAGASSCIATLGASATTTATGSCNLAPPPPASGSAYTVTAAYAGNATFAASSSGGVADGTLTVNQASTTTTIGTHTPSPSFVGGPIAVSATVVAVAPGAGTPTGTIVVSDGTDSCTITLPSPSCNLTPTTQGAKTLTATYQEAGDTNFAGSVSAGVAHTVNPAGSVVTTSVVTLVNPGTVVFGQTVAVTASVTAQTGTAEPVGNVTLAAGASSCIVALGASATTTATATCNLAPPPGVGGSPYTVTAGYAGNATFAASSSSGVGNGTLTVNQASTATAIGTHTPNPSNVGAPIAVTATVAAVAPGAGTPTGIITVSDGTASCVINLPGTSCNLVPTSSGAKTLTATYGGDANFVTSGSVGVAHQVNSGGSIVTTTAVTLVNPGSAVFGQPVAVTAAVTRATSGAAPNGSVTINAGGSSCVGTLQAPAVNTSTATCNLSPPLLPSGSAYSVTASYAGTATFQASASSGGGNGTLNVSAAATTTTIGAHTPNPSFVLTPIAVTAIVAATPPGAGTPTGTITVSDGTDNCVISLPATSCNLTPTTAGPKTLVATYGGEARFLASASAGTAHTVDLLTVFSGPTATPGVTATVTLTGGLQGCTMVEPEFIDVAPLVPPLGVQFPFGLFDFSTAGCGTGETISIEIVYSQALPDDAQYWKYGPTPGGGDNSLPHWYVLPGATVAGTVVTFDITDGLIGDDDLLANGEIVDQGGPGSTVESIPTASGWMLVLMALALLGVGWRATRGLGGRG